jgi:hypothetical protein
MSVRQVASWLGHADPAMTLRKYIALIPNELQAPAELDAMLPNPLPIRENGQSVMVVHPLGKSETAAIS